MDICIFLKKKIKRYKMMLKVGCLNGNKIPKRMASSGSSKKISKFFQEIGELSNLDVFPSELKRVSKKKVHSSEDGLYVASNNAAVTIAKAIKPHYLETVPFFEINPGPCILSKALLKHLKPTTLTLVHSENSHTFAPIQQKLVESHESQMFLKNVLWKWNECILEHSEKHQWHDTVTAQLFLNTRSQKFIYHLLNDVVWQKRLFANGRVELFVILPEIEFKKFTANTKDAYTMYTHKCCLFQTLFDYELLSEISKSHFLPWYNILYRGHVEHDKDLCYLVRMVPKKNLLIEYQPDDLPALKYFIHQCFFKRTGSIIPILEKWIPNVGVAITNSSEAFDTLNLPKLSMFTESGSLTPEQIVTIFKFFRQLPEYKTSCFHDQCNEFYTKKYNKED